MQLEAGPGQHAVERKGVTSRSLSDTARLPSQTVSQRSPCHPYKQQCLLEFIVSYCISFLIIHVPLHKAVKPFKIRVILQCE